MSELSGFQKVCFNALENLTTEMAEKLPTEWPTTKALVADVLISAGYPRGEAASNAAVAVWAMRDEVAAPVATPTASGVSAPEMAQLLTTLGQTLTNANRDTCPHCQKILPKDFDGNICPKCAMPVRQTMKCLNCATENEGVAEGDHCKKCGTTLVGSETRNMVSYLIRVRNYGSAGQAMSEVNRIRAAADTEWTVLKAQTEAWVSGGGLADVATFLNATKATPGRHFNIRATGEW